VTTGFVHIDSIADPYSKIVTEVSKISDDDFSQQIHGYYWAVLLTDGHLDRLGGLAAVRAQAPCAEVKVVESPQGEAALCVLTDSPLDIDAERIVAWRRFLLPILRPGYPGSHGGAGVPGAPLHRPVWLFEGPPVPAGTRRLLSFPSTPDHLPIPRLGYGAVGDPERPVCLLYPGEGFDPDLHFGLVQAVVKAWATAGRLERLHEVKGALGPCTEVEWDTDDDVRSVLTWQFDVGEAEPVAALERLSAALSRLEKIHGTPPSGRVLTELVVA
jgi:hypothetical protein